MGTKASIQQIYAVPSKVVGSTEFEELSNELIYEVFDHLSFYHISRAFGRLNQRLESLIDTHSHYLNLQQHTSADICTFPRWIHSLKINARYQIRFIDVANLRSVHHLLLSNLPVAFLLHVFSTAPLHDLRYIYLGACLDEYASSETQLGEVQGKVLALGQQNLKKCVFRMQLCADVEALPSDLPSLESLRIDGCENIFIVSKLLDRMSCLKSLQVSVLKSMPSGQETWNSPATRHSCLTNLTLRMHDWRSPDELMPLLTRYCANVRNLTIYLDPVPACHSYTSQRHSPHLKDLRQWITISVQPLLPQLAHFRLRQRIIPKNDQTPEELLLKAPYQEDILGPSQDKSYRVTVAAHLSKLWDSTI